MELHSAKALENFAVIATDGDVGTVDEVYFDDEKWAIRYLVVDTGDWLAKRDVLISPISIRHVDWEKHTLRADLTQQQIRDSPGIDTAGPVSRRQEEELHRYYGYRYYWNGPFMWGDTVFPGVEEMPVDETDEQRAVEQALHPRELADPHLCSSKELVAYAIRTTDGSGGHVDDLLFDAEDWSIRFLVIDPRNWWPGKDVLVAPQRIDHIDREGQCVVTPMSRAELEHSPAYDPRHPPPASARQSPQARR